jgi:hypothetical protein
MFLTPKSLQVSCEGPLGKTSLKDPLPSDPSVYFRTDDVTPKVIILLMMMYLFSPVFLTYK